ncbi:hypothetical protein [Sphingomonas sp. Leaf10]|uniref:hypothetical protein n=1 Tax=Sphingomonas sp. Leaf10 TaxID=1735676 RepID=UPI0012E1876E|nr:hypothetical protein [Sphingomonas sp. Leaf10]
MPTDQEHVRELWHGEIAMSPNIAGHQGRILGPQLMFGDPFTSVQTVVTRAMTGFGIIDRSQSWRQTAGMFPFSPYLPSLIEASGDYEWMSEVGERETTAECRFLGRVTPRYFTA